MSDEYFAGPISSDGGVVRRSARPELLYCGAEREREGGVVACLVGRNLLRLRYKKTSGCGLASWLGLWNCQVSIK